FESRSFIDPSIYHRFLNQPSSSKGIIVIELITHRNPLNKSKNTDIIDRINPFLLRYARQFKGIVNPVADSVLIMLVNKISQILLDSLNDRAPSHCFKALSII